ncbi:DUF2184 domain-containing protein [Klebsiella pneumoniae]
MKTFDSTLAYYVNQLDNLDKKLYEPLFSVTWGRDIKLRTGITMANESTSFIRSTIGAVGTQNATGKPWISPNTTTLPGVSINGERVTLPLRLLGQEVSYSSVELERSQLLGQPIDAQKFNALNTIYQMATDEMIYVGDTAVGAEGLVNSTLVTSGSVPNGTGGSPLWINKTPDEILKDVNDMITAAWQASGFAVCPDKLLLPPAQFAYISSQKISTAGNVSILTFLEDNSISLRVNGRKLDIQPLKWLTGRGTGGADRMVAYTNDEERVRFPMVPIRRETPYYLGIKFNAPYIWAFGEVEFVYPETAVYRDGI